MLFMWQVWYDTLASNTSPSTISVQRIACKLLKCCPDSFQPVFSLTSSGASVATMRVPMLANIAGKRSLPTPNTRPLLPGFTTPDSSK